MNIIIINTNNNISIIKNIHFRSLNISEVKKKNYYKIKLYMYI